MVKFDELCLVMYLTQHSIYESIDTIAWQFVSTLQLVSFTFC